MIKLGRTVQTISNCKIASLGIDGTTCSTGGRTKRPSSFDNCPDFNLIAKIGSLKLKQRGLSHFGHVKLQRRLVGLPFCALENNLKEESSAKLNNPYKVQQEGALPQQEGWVRIEIRNVSKSWGLGGIFSSKSLIIVLTPLTRGRLLRFKRFRKSQSELFRLSASVYLIGSLIDSFTTSPSLSNGSKGVVYSNRLTP